MADAGARGGPEALASIALRPHVLLMDLRMPDMDGVQVIQAVREAETPLRAIVSSTYDSQEDIYRALHAGAKPNLLKDSPADTLLEAIRAVRGGEPRFPQRVLVKLTDRLRSRGLSAREREVLMLLGRGRSNKEIAQDLSVAESTVKVPVAKILERLGAASRTEAVTLAVKRGLVTLACTGHRSLSSRVNRDRRFSFGVRLQESTLLRLRRTLVAIAVDRSSAGVRVADASDLIPDEVVLSSDGYGWPHLKLLRLRQTASELDVPGMASHTVCVMLDSAADTVARIGDEKFLGSLDRGSVTLLPANLPSWWTFPHAVSDDAIHLSLQSAFVSETALALDLNPANLELAPRIGAVDSQLEHLAYALCAELHAGCPSGRLFAESAAAMIAVHLLKNYQLVEEPIRTHKGGLTTRKLHRALAYMHEHLAHDISLHAIAAEVGLSPYHFARLLKQSVGLAPHQYVTLQRVKRAKELLQKSTLPIVDVGRAVGLHSQSGFTSLFRKHTGVTPKRYREGS